MPENNHKVGFKLESNPSSIDIYIDRERINAIGFYPVDKNRKRINLEEKMDLEFDVAELEVRDIAEIAAVMNKETFDKFCEFWKKFHGKGE